MKSSEILTLKGMTVVSVQACQLSQSTQPGLWDSVLELTKSAQERNSDPLLWAVQLSSILNSAGTSLPSPELAHLLVSHICWANNVPITWKFLEKAVSGRIAPPMLVLALLSSRFFFLIWFWVYFLGLMGFSHFPFGIFSFWVCRFLWYCDVPSLSGFVLGFALARGVRPPTLFFYFMCIGMYVHPYVMCMVVNAYTDSLIIENGWVFF